MYDTYLFDLDETLVYTTDAGKEFVVTEALSEFSVEPTFHEILDLWYGRNRDQLIKKAWNLIPEEFWVVYNQKDTVEFRKEYTRPYKDAKIVARIKNAGSDIGVVTASREEIADYGLGLIGRDLFDALVSTHGDPLKKPHRDPE